MAPAAEFFIAQGYDVTNIDYPSREHSIEYLAPPNGGSQVVDNLRDVLGFEEINGPAGMQLGTDADSVPVRLGEVDFELGVIAGTSTINPLLSLQLPNPDDGKVSVENAKVEGMADFLTVPVSHPFIMSDDIALQQAQHFFENGKFQQTETGVGQEDG